MSEEIKTAPVQAVRIPLTPETRRHRTLDERILVRFPGLFRWFGAAWAGLPRHSQLRRMMLVFLVRRNYAAANRRDFGQLLTALDSGIVYHPGELWQFDFDAAYHGHGGYLEVWRKVLESFENLRLDPEELLDLGDRFLVTVKLSGHGAGSGVFVSQPHFQLFTLRRGLVVRQDDFADHAKALEAAGLLE